MPVFSPLGAAAVLMHIARPAAWGICLFVFPPTLGTGEAKETQNDSRVIHLQHKTWVQ